MTIPRLKQLSIAGVLAIHKDLLRRYRGGRSGEVDMVKLELAIIASEMMIRDPHWKRRARLAAQYGWRILKGRPFAQGNTPMALAALVTFLEMNHFPWHASEVEETVMVQEAAAGHLSEAAWEAWVLSKMGKQQRGKNYSS
jgi:prophage maintenance system killer protein